MRYFLLSAILVSIAINFPQTLGWFSFFSLIPILVYLDQSIETREDEYHLRKMFFFGFVFSLISTSYFLETFPLSWLSITNPLVSIVIIGGIWVTFSAAMALPLMIWPFLLTKFPSSSKSISALSASSLFVILEFVRSWFVTISLYGDGTVFGPHHTYYSLGYTLSHLPILNNILAVGGLYLGSFLIILSNFVILYVFKVYRDKEEFDFKLLVAVLILCFAGSFLTMKVIRSAAPPLLEMPATLINTNFPSGTKYNQDHRNFVSLLAPEGVSELSNLVISPEGFQIDQLFLGPKDDSQQIFIGTTGESSGKIMYFNEYKTRSKYFTSKSILMPIGDYRLLWTDVILKLTQDEGWLFGYFKRFNNDVITPHNLYKDSASPLLAHGSVCSDNISPYIYRIATNEGANVLINIASHAPFKKSQLLSRQTLAVNTARALENGRYFLVAANFDNSLLIDDRGKLIYSSHNNALVSFDTVKFNLETYLTPYVRFGDYILYISLFLLLYLKTRYRRKT